MKYYLPTKIILGGLESELKGEIDLFQPKKILLITGGKAMKEVGITDKLLNCLKGYQITIFDQVKPNPTPEIVEEAEQESDLVIGLGGGSVMDVAKVVATNLKKPCIAIPTTCGTGSEVTPFAALYDWEKKKKMSLTVNFPKVAFVDYRLTLSLPSQIVAATGIDALSQAIEAYWSIYSTPLTDVHAREAIDLIIKNLKDSWEGNETAREKMSLAALEAGRAFSQTMTTAVHSVSYPITIHYSVPHGAACGLTLPHFLVYNYQVSEKDCLDKRGADFVKRRIEEIATLIGAKDIEEAKETMLNLMESVNLPVSLDLDTEIIIKDAFTPERVGNNPRRLDEINLRKIIQEVNNCRRPKQ